MMEHQGRIPPETRGLVGLQWLRQHREDFWFGPHLPIATFPQDFAERYARTDKATFDGTEAFVAELQGVSTALFLDAFFNPYDIYFHNWSASEGQYATANAQAIPRGYIIIGDVVNDIDSTPYRLLVDLETHRPTYGAIFVWPMAFYEAGSGDNMAAPTKVADNLSAFLDELISDEEVAERVRGGG
ncbi:SMI1/KNR4 family protein [Roseobacter weihaiensis]|uniref:SMI1/KNR4 family protein n=1 Tax=Roseobacter weihaiensis TaxID=2763262 RepID=UPI001D0A0A40|nr:SMI1/KNR4 family protein [Roseobacter sp. H9]